jgi:hypothetical protein
MIRIFNKYIIMKVTIFILALCLGSCKTKEKVTEKRTETAQTVSSSVATLSGQTKQLEQTALAEEATHTGWSDSIVDKFYERIVTDSTGRVLLHEVEHSKDTYKGMTQSQMKRTGNRQEKSTAQNQEQSYARNDSGYNGSSLNEVTVVKKRSWRWLWFVGLLVGLFLAGYIITRVKR